MIKNLKYILILSFLISCFEINKPFEDAKINMSNEKNINSGLFISDIIGLSKNIELIFKNKISKQLINKNILSSYNFYSKNSHILKATVVSYNNNKKIIFNLYSPIANINNKLEILIADKDLKNHTIQEIISDKVSEFVEKIIFKKNKIKLIKIIKINGLTEEKKQKYIFIKTLLSQQSKKSIKFIKNTKDIDSDYLLEINFKIEKINDNKIKLQVDWQLYDHKNELIGNIRQENIFLKSLLHSIWPQISSKIIEMALAELGLLINV